MSRNLVATNRKQETPPAPRLKAKPQRRPPQFPLLGLLGLMGVVSIALAPAFYMVRGAQGERGSQLAGMLMILAGPLLLVVVVSSLMAILQWWKGR